MRLGIPSIRHLYAELTPKEVRRWVRFYREEPWSEDCTDQVLATGFAQVSNIVLKSAGAKNPDVKPEMFRPMLPVGHEKTRKVPDRVPVSDFMKASRLN